MSITSVRKSVGSGHFISFFITALCLYSIMVHAVEIIADPNTIVSSPVLEESVVVKTADGTWTELIGQRNSNTRVWEVIKDGERSVVHEVGGGVCYKDARGKWRVSDTSWTATADGFVMDKAGYKLEIGKTAGSLMKYYVDGRKLKVRPSALLADDNGKAVKIAQLDAAVTGQIGTNNPNKLVFANAFGTGIDLEIEAKPGGYHQNVIFHQKPTFPKGLDPATTKMRLFTEMDLDGYENSRAGTVGLQLGRLKKAEALNLNDPNTLSAESAFEEVSVSQLANTKRTRGNIRFMADDGTGNKRMSHFLGRSDIFTINSGTNGVEHKNIATAEKEFIRNVNDGRTYLVETLDASVLEQATYPVIWDYHNISSDLSGNVLWKSGETYYVSSEISVGSGNTLTIESGVVVKFAGSAGISANGGTITAQGKPYLPIIFTSKDHDDYGEIIPGSTGSPYPSHGGIEIEAGSTFEHCDVYYASSGLTVKNRPAIPVRHNYFARCQQAICVDVSGSVSGSIDIFNNLISGKRPYEFDNDPCSMSTGIKVLNNDPCSITVRLAYNTVDHYYTGVLIGGWASYSVEVLDCLFTDISSMGVRKFTTYGSITVNAHHNGFWEIYNDSFYDSGLSGSNDRDLGSSGDSPPANSPYDDDPDCFYHLDQACNLIDAASDPCEVFTEGSWTTSLDVAEINYPATDIGYHHSCQNPFNTPITWYVDDTGDDSNAGTTLESSFAINGGAKLYHLAGG